MCVGFRALSFRCMICVFIDLGVVLYILYYIASSSEKNVAYNVFISVNSEEIHLLIFLYRRFCWRC
ncbi:unnamed protein product [Nezara viridula]|uniref:Uncharacterized protein n=1 Tax=Nezara viridula TaxID=85310 RepID=A0A9P0MNF5_NEZVI|nr:unnamed protein product [Nezara viridula]